MDTKIDERCLNVFNELDKFIKLFDDKIDKQAQQIKTCEKRNKLELQLAKERKLNKVLTEQLAEVSRHSNKLNDLCAALISRLTITDNDMKRLEKAKSEYELGKKLNGVRFDFTAPRKVAKGYIKNEHRRLLQPFEVDTSAGGDSEALWAAIQATTSPEWSMIYNNENKPLN